MFCIEKKLKEVLPPADNVPVMPPTDNVPVMPPADNVPVISLSFSWPKLMAVVIIVALVWGASVWGTYHFALASCPPIRRCPECPQILATEPPKFCFLNTCYEAFWRFLGYFICF